MQRRGVRLGLVIAFVIAVAGAGGLLYSEHQRSTKAMAAARELEVVRDHLHAVLDEARLGLVAALAPGQSDDYWVPRVTAALDSAKSDVARMKSITRSSSASDLDAAVEALERVSSQRAEVARFLAADMRTQAARLVLGDGLQALADAGGRVESVRWDEKSRDEAEAAAAQALLWLLLGGLAALSLIVVGLLLPLRNAEVANAPAEATPAVPAAPTEDASRAAASPEPMYVAGPPPARDAFQVQDVGPTVAPPEQASLASPSPASENGTTPPQVDRRKAPELRAAADLCTDFARLVDAQEMPALLERAARLLDATGFIVWIADADGQHLRASLAHGFSAQTLQRLPAIPRHADNATAAAFRHAEMQVVRTNGMSPGAIVVPILGAGGCVGAMAAEVRHGREASESARALARIVAAQLGSLIGTPAAKAIHEPAGDAAQAV